MKPDSYCVVAPYELDRVLVVSTVEVVREFYVDQPTYSVVYREPHLVFESVHGDFNTIINVSMLIIGYAKFLESFIHDPARFLQKFGFAIFRLILPSSFEDKMLDNDVILALSGDGEVFAYSRNRRISSIELTNMFEAYVKRFGDIPNVEDLVGDDSGEYVKRMNDVIEALSTVHDYDMFDDGSDTLHIGGDDNEETV